MSSRKINSFADGQLYVDMAEDRANAKNTPSKIIYQPIHAKSWSHFWLASERKYAANMVTQSWKSVNGENYSLCCSVHESTKTPTPPPRDKVGIWKKPWSNLEKYPHPWGCLLKSKRYLIPPVLKMVTGQTRLLLVAKCTLDFRIVLSRVRFWEYFPFRSKCGVISLADCCCWPFLSWTSKKILKFTEWRFFITRSRLN